MNEGNKTIERHEWYQRDNCWVIVEAHQQDDGWRYSVNLRLPTGGTVKPATEKFSHLRQTSREALDDARKYVLGRIEGERKFVHTKAHHAILDRIEKAVRQTDQPELF